MPSTRIHIHTALSLSRPAATLLQQVPLPLRVVSAHRHACNLRSEQQQFLALVSPKLGNGPFHIVVTQPLLAQLAVGDSLVGGADGLRWAGGNLALRHAPVWEARVAWPRLDGDSAQQLWQAIDGAASASIFLDSVTAPEHERARQGATQISHGLSTRNIDALGDGVRLLAGLGPGLTPAGDDFLLGVMAGVQMLHRERDAQRICARVATVAAPRTTSLSVAWLRHAARGALSEPWHHLRRALVLRRDSALTAAVARIAGVGASSGCDALAGLSCALGAIRPWPAAK